MKEDRPMPDQELIDMLRTVLQEELNLLKMI